MTVEVGEFGEVIVPEPLTMLQLPVPGKVTGLPARVTLVVGVQIDWSGPAFAIGCVALNTKMLT